MQLNVQEQEAACEHPTMHPSYAFAMFRRSENMRAGKRWKEMERVCDGGSRGTEMMQSEGK
jgi:hypothetical protein